MLSLQNKRRPSFLFVIHAAPTNKPSPPPSLKIKHNTHARARAQLLKTAMYAFNGVVRVCGARAGD
jgi:hypothetical protein